MEGPSTPGRDGEFDSLEAEITELWGHVNAATFRFLALVAEFDRREGWARHGLANCAQWLNWQCGIGAVAAREKLRVAHALESLPLIGEAFRSGRVSYSKVRAITRVATPESEAGLLNVALHGTAMHVEKLVRQYRRVERLEEARLAESQHRARFLRMYHDEDGALVLNARVPAEVGAIVRKAIEAAMETEREAANVAETEATSQYARDAHGPGDAATDRPALEARRADALRLLAEQFLSDEARRCPSSADRYQVVVHVDAAALSEDPAPVNAAMRAGSEVGAHLPAANRPHRRTRRVCCELEDGPALAVDTARRIACDSAIVMLVESSCGEPLDVGRKSRSIHPALRRALKARDGGCRFPGCDRTRFTEAHHVEHWANGGETRLSNLITLCGFHHRQLHEGGYRLESADDGHFVFYRPDGRRIHAAGSATECFRGNIFSDECASEFSDQVLRAEHAALGLDINPATSRSRWFGEPMDYDLAIEALWRQRDRTSAAAPIHAPAPVPAPAPAPAPA